MRATLISYTRDPLETMWTIWEQSKTDDHLPEIIEGAYNLREANVAELFRAAMDQEIPVAEVITFNFVCENVPISWREQAVRHRIGVAYGDNFSVDVIPEMTGSSFWSQSHRLKDMSRFVERGEYFVPESILADADALGVYGYAMDRIQDAYAALIRLGIPAEDARNVIPLGTTHRIAMTINLRALKGIIGKRSCWILQAGIWEPMIRTMVEELCERIDPVFRALVHPPCVSGGKFTECKFKHENERRVDGRDAMPPCPLFLTSEIHNGRAFGSAELEARIPKYAALWDQPKLSETWKWTPSDERNGD